VSAISTTSARLLFIIFTCDVDRSTPASLSTATLRLPALALSAQRVQPALEPEDSARSEPQDGPDEALLPFLTCCT
jgi:hypothetical protein